MACDTVHQMEEQEYSVESCYISLVKDWPQSWIQVCLMLLARSLVPAVAVVTDAVTLRLATKNVSRETVGAYGTPNGRPLILYHMTVKQILVLI